MAIFIELRCELNVTDECWSHTNSGPYNTARDTTKSIGLAVNELFAEAKEAGWQRWGSGWVCPACVADVEAAIQGRKKTSAPAQEGE